MSNGYLQTILDTDILSVQAYKVTENLPKSRKFLQIGLIFTRIGLPFHHLFPVQHGEEE